MVTMLLLDFPWFSHYLPQKPGTNIALAACFFLKKQPPCHTGLKNVTMVQDTTVRNLLSCAVYVFILIFVHVLLEIKLKFLVPRMMACLLKQHELNEGVTSTALQIFRPEHAPINAVLIILHPSGSEE